MSKKSKIAALKSKVISKNVKEVRKSSGPIVHGAKADVAAVIEAAPGKANGESVKIDAPNFASMNSKTQQTREISVQDATVASAWNYPAKFFEMTEENSKFILQFAGRFTSARSAQDMLTVSSDFSKEGGRLLQQQSNDVLKMMLAGWAAGSNEAHRVTN
jgi:hypothetical protein